LSADSIPPTGLGTHPVSRNFTMSSLLMASMMMTLFGISILLPIDLQNVHLYFCSADHRRKPRTPR
jgi:hypothetical protein